MLTGLATATYPDGSTPEVEDVARVASNVFSAGQETTVRLLGAALQTMGSVPTSKRSYAKTAAWSPTSSKSRCATRARSRATSG